MVKHCGTRGCEHFKNMRWPLVQTYGLELTSETRSSIHAAKMSSHTESRGQVVSLSSGSRYSISAMLAPAFGPPLPPVSLPRAAVRGGRRHLVRPVRRARARARRPRGAMLAISGFQSTAPAARRGAKLFINIRPVGRKLDNFFANFLNPQSAVRFPRTISRF